MNPDLPAFLEALPIPALAIGTDERVLAANDGAGRLFGPGAMGRHYITVLRHPVLLDCVERALAGQGRQSARYLATQAGRDATWAVTAAPLGSGAGESAPVLVSFEDVGALEEAGQIRRDFVANVSHELRTPLTALMSFIETLRGAARDDPGARARFLETMEREAQRMSRLVDDLLSLSRVETVERQRPTEPVDVAALARRVVQSMDELAQRSGARIVLTGADAPATVPGDADQLAQVLTNLVENALKYGAPGGEVTVSLAAEDVAAPVRGPALRLDVTDRGEGIDPLHLPRLTERFYRVDSHRSRAQGGTGLGLAIVKHIVNRHRGRLKIRSAPGEGSTFSVYLPSD